MAAVFIRETGETIALDNTFDVSVSYVSTVTDHPVETGVNVSDHSQPRAPEISVTGLVSETPRVTAGREVSYPDTDNRGREIVASFVAAKDSAALMTAVLPGHGVFENVVVTSIRPQVVNVNVKRFSISLRQVRLADRITVNIPPLRPNADASPGIADEQDVGQQPTTNPESVDNAQRSSLLYSIGTSFGWIE